MNGSDTSDKDRQNRLMARGGKGRATLTICSLLALGFVAALPMPAAQAQFFRRFWAPDYDGYPPPVPPRDVGRRPTAYMPPPEMAPPAGEASLPVSITEIRRHATVAGLKLLGTPHRKGDLYIAFGEDSHGQMHHLTFDAYDGRIIENEVSTTAIKAAPPHPAATATAPTHPAAPAATAAISPTTPPTTPTAVAPHLASPHPTSPAQAGTSAVSSDKTLPAPSVTAKDDDLSPIKPQPGTHAVPHLPNGEIDKD
ncbi:MAG: hypothetical protein ACLP8A_12500 [Methylovirgula sp.]